VEVEMIDNKFSAKAFANTGYGTTEARKLSKELQIAIQEELDIVINPAMIDIINKLNNLGHKLVVDGELKIGDKRFIEPYHDESKRYKFLVALDVVISVGYPDTVDSSPFIDELMEQMRLEREQELS
jgi:hypothetical protein